MRQSHKGKIFNGRLFSSFMVQALESKLIENGLKRIDSLEEVVESNSFLVNSNSESEGLFLVYPVLHRRANLTHNLLNLYGVHWRYKVSSSNWDEIEQEDGDSKLVFRNIAYKEKVQRFAAYAFTQRDVERHKSLWVFVPNTLGWEYYQEILIPRFSEDYREYQNAKRMVRPN